MDTPTPISAINTIITKRYLQTQPENQYFERKGIADRNIKQSKIADELIGMLNADGGTLAFGVSDTGELQDLSVLPNLDDYRKLVFDFIKPPCTIELEEIWVDEKLLFLFHVEPDLERIFSRKDNEDIFLRVADSNRRLDCGEVTKLEYDKNIRHFEDEIVPDFDIEDIDMSLMGEYIQKINYSGDWRELLHKRHLVTKKDNVYTFKKSAILLFAKDPEKYIPSASVRYIRYSGTEALVGSDHNVIKDQRFEDNIPNLIRRLRDFLKLMFVDHYFLDITQGKFIKVPEYPEEAWLEGIVNALCHRSYNLQGSAVYLKHFDNRIEISNSGPLPAQVTIENIKEERFARNPRIARVLEDLGYVRQLNEGVARIYKAMDKSMLAEPEYREINDNIYLTLRNHIKGHMRTVHQRIMNYIEERWEQLNETEQRILQYLLNHGSATLNELAESTQVNQNTLRTYLNHFIIQNILEKHSTKKRDINAMYAFKKE